MIVKGIVRYFGNLIKEAEGRIIEALKDGRIETETQITDRFLQAIEEVFDKHGEKGKIKFRARTFRDKGSGAQERIYGADFCGVLDISFKNFELRKGFLSQAKMEKGGISIMRGTTVKFIKDREFKRLNEQIDKMLYFTPDSFVIIYSKDGFVVVPASSVKGLKKNDKLYGEPVDRFFKEFLNCFIGDYRLEAWDNGTIKSLMREKEARTAIMFQIYERKYGEHFYINP